MGNFVSYVFKTLKTSILRPFKLVQRKIKKNLFFKSKVAKAIKTSVKETVKIVKKTPDQPTDYVLIGSRYFAKRLVIVGIVGVIAFYLLFTIVLYPFARGRLFTPTATLAEPYLATYTGKIHLNNREGIRIYDGTFVNGMCDGEGVQYDDQGRLVYEGQFKSDLYEGEGILYGEGGRIVYKGSFSGNLFSDYGKAYDASGTLYYEGSFENGVFQGNGKLYDAGNLVYAGDFVQGIKNGYGVTYDETGMIRHTGNYQNGVFQDEGTLYNADGQRIYSGTFANGLFEGAGKLFYPNGVLAYEGNFLQGLYQGEGKLYESEGALSYEGSFAAGKFDGLGLRKLGTLTYEGNFSEGLYDGVGTVSEFGQTLFHGSFSQGSAMLSEMIGAESSILGDAFGDDGVITMYANDYTVYYKGAGALVVLSLPTETDPPLILRVFDTHSVLLPELETMDFSSESSKVIQASSAEETWYYTLVGSAYALTDAIAIDAENYEVIAHISRKTNTMLFYEVKPKEEE